MATLVIFANAVGLILFLRSRSDRLLAAIFDPVHPDWLGMERAFAGFTVYAVSLLGVVAIGALLLVRFVVRRRSPRDADAPPRRMVLSGAALSLTVTAAVVLVFIEVLIFQDYGIHFYEFDVLGILADAALRRDLGIQPAEVARVIGAAMALLGAEAVLCWAAARMAAWRNGALPRACTAAMLVLVPGGLMVFRSSESDMGPVRAEFEAVLPLGRSLLFREVSGPHLAVEPRSGMSGYPTLADDWQAPAIPVKRNILFFVPDGLRADMATPDLTPNLWRFASRPDVIHSLRHYSSGHVSEAGIFGLLYALNGHDFNSFIGARIQSWPVEVLKRNGYHTFFLSSSRLNPYPTDQLIRTFDEVAFPANDDEALRTLDAYLARRRADGRPYFVLAFLYTPHYPFTSAKPAFRRFPDVGPKARTNYMNDVLQADDYFRQVFGMVQDDYDAGRTIVLATSDHGEEIRDHGVFGHASPTFWNEKIQVPFALGLPGAHLTDSQRRADGSVHADVWPTVFDFLQLEPLVPSERYSDGRSLLAPQDGIPHPAFVAGRFFPSVDRPSVLIDSTRKYWFSVDHVGPNAELCLEVTRVTDLNDNPVSRDSVPPDAAAIPAFNRLQDTFWRFIRYVGPQSANCGKGP